MQNLSSKDLVSKYISAIADSDINNVREVYKELRKRHVEMSKEISIIDENSVDKTN